MNVLLPLRQYITNCLQARKRLSDDPETSLQPL